LIRCGKPGNIATGREPVKRRNLRFDAAKPLVSRGSGPYILLNP